MNYYFHSRKTANLEVERLDYYRKNSNCQNLYYSYFPTSRKFDIVNRDFVKDVNKIIFDFIWKGKDKVKRSALISVIEDGGLKAPHLDSIIETQRVLSCKKLASDHPNK